MSINSIGNPSVDMAMKLTRLKDESIVESNQMADFAVAAETMGLDTVSSGAVTEIAGLSAEAGELDEALSDVVSESLQTDAAAFAAQTISQLIPPSIQGLGENINTLA